MEFILLHKETKKEVSFDDFEEFARNNGLMEMDLEGFAMEEDNTLLLMDECGNFTYIPREEKYIICYKIDDETIYEEIY